MAKMVKIVDSEELVARLRLGTNATTKAHAEVVARVVKIDLPLGRAIPEFCFDELFDGLVSSQMLNLEQLGIEAVTLKRMLLF